MFGKKKKKGESVPAKGRKTEISEDLAAFDDESSDDEEKSDDDDNDDYDDEEEDESDEEDEDESDEDDESDDDESDDDDKKNDANENTGGGTTFYLRKAGEGGGGDSDDDDDDDEDFNNEPKAQKPPGCFEKSCGCFQKCFDKIGVAACAGILCCVIFLLLALIIGLSVGLTVGKKNKDIDETTATTPETTAAEEAATKIMSTNSTDGGDTTAAATPPQSPLTTITLPPMTPDNAKIPMRFLTSSADTTIYTDGALRDTANGDETTMLVQNGPPGNTELPTAYSLVQFDGGDESTLLNIGGVESPNLQFCLFRAAPADESDKTEENTGESSKTYTACLVPSPTTGSIEDMTGSSAATLYKMPDDCLNGKTVALQVNPSYARACADATPLFLTAGGAANTTTAEGVNNTRTRSRSLLRGGAAAFGGDDAKRQRVLQTTTNETNATATTTIANATTTTANDTNTTDTTDTAADDTADSNSGGGGGGGGANPAATSSSSYLFMIASLEESGQPGDRFYTRNEPKIGHRPKLALLGRNTCMTLVDQVCYEPDLSILCGLLLSSGGGGFDPPPFPSTTIFAPNDEAFGKLDDPELLNDTETVEQILQYHLAEGEIKTKDLKCGNQTVVANGESRTTVCGANQTLFQAGRSGGVAKEAASMPKLIKRDIDACDGVVHVMDQVLLPPPGDLDKFDPCGNATGSTSLADVFCSTLDSPDTSTFCDLMKHTGADSVLAEGGGDFTIFAPSNLAIRSTFGAIDESLAKDNAAFITNILLQHIVYGEAIQDCVPFVTMANGEQSNMICGDNGSITSIGGPGNQFESFPKIVNESVSTCNGFMYFVDGLILPIVETAASTPAEDVTGVSQVGNSTEGVAAVANNTLDSNSTEGADATADVADDSLGAAIDDFANTLVSNLTEGVDDLGSAIDAATNTLVNNVTQGVDAIVDAADVDPSSNAPSDIIVTGNNTTINI